MELAVPVVVLDTNIVLDLFVFDDSRADSLRTAITAKKWQWIATLPMREELLRVLAYPHIAKRLLADHAGGAWVLAQFDALAQIKPIATKAAIRCKDPDDQKFIDLAVAHTSQLWSKDHAIVCMRKRLLRFGVTFCVWL